MSKLPRIRWVSIGLCAVIAWAAVDRFGPLYGCGLVATLMALLTSLREIAEREKLPEKNEYTLLESYRKETRQFYFPEASNESLPKYDWFSLAYGYFLGKGCSFQEAYQLAIKTKTQ